MSNNYHETGKEKEILEVSLNSNNNILSNAYNDALKSQNQNLLDILLDVNLPPFPNFEMLQTPLFDYNKVNIPLTMPSIEPKLTTITNSPFTINEQPFYTQAPTGAIKTSSNFPVGQLPYNSPPGTSIIDSSVLRTLLQQNQQMLTLLQQLVQHLITTPKESQSNHEIPIKTSNDSQGSSDSSRSPRGKSKFINTFNQRPIISQQFRRHPRNDRNSIKQKITSNVHSNNQRNKSDFSHHHNNPSGSKILPYPKSLSGVSCTYCKKLGHNIRLCRKRPYCTYCSKRGHVSLDCFDRQNKCLYCTQIGHLISQCTKRPRKTPKLDDTLECPFCQEDHLGINCSKNRNSSMELSEESVISTSHNLSVKLLSTSPTLVQKSVKSPQDIPLTPLALDLLPDKQVKIQKSSQENSLMSLNPTSLPDTQVKIEKSPSITSNLSISSENSLKSMPIPNLLPEEQVENKESLHITPKLSLSSESFIKPLTIPSLSLEKQTETTESLQTVSNVSTFLENPINSPTISSLNLSNLSQDKRPEVVIPIPVVSKLSTSFSNTVQLLNISNPPPVPQTKVEKSSKENLSPPVYPEWWEFPLYWNDGFPGMFDPGKPSKRKKRPKKSSLLPDSRNEVVGSESLSQETLNKPIFSLDYKTIISKGILREVTSLQENGYFVDNRLNKWCFTTNGTIENWPPKDGQVQNQFAVLPDCNNDSTVPSLTKDHIRILQNVASLHKAGYYMTKQGYRNNRLIRGCRIDSIAIA